jgi:hypothetical protein
MPSWRRRTEDFDDADRKHDLPDEDRRSGDVHVGERLVEEVSPEEQAKRGSEPQGYCGLGSGSV